ncbi:MAG: cell division FtsA domain-containing protein, partial [Cytophagaceae bacterium]|nr:cell division FtsA domain-containing protein [Cytophagaceae bacterium]
RKAKPSGDIINAKSEFKIDSARYRKRNPGAFMPLVLQRVYKSLDYTGKAAWVNGTFVPHFHEASWRNNARQLPNTADFYPFLTVNDFLEPTLIRLVYPINRARYFDGNLRRYNDKSQRSYLLPLKPDFFEFFSAEELASDVVQLRIEETQQAGAGTLSTSRVRVILRVPIAAKGQYVEFSKEYEEKPDQPVSDQTKKGQIVERQFGLTLFPCLRIDDPAFVPQYRVHLVDRDVAAATYNEAYSLKFYADGDALAPLPGIAARERSKKQINVGAQTTVYPVRQNFERIDVEVGGYRGVILPKWRKESLGDGTFTVAIDFGTTNTHIEYNTASDPTPRPFTIEAEDIQIATLHDPATPEEVFNDSGANAIADLVPLELIPERIGPGHLSRFPQRSVLLENKPDFSLNPIGFADFNVAFSYERRVIPVGHKSVSDLKWADLAHQGDAPRKRVEAYFQSLLFLVRNKILLNGGNPDRTDLRWFYPLSMTIGQSQTFDDTWRSAAHDYLGPNAQVRKVPESIAPFYWYSRGGGANARIVAYGHPSVLVDIGGGTSDIVVFEDNQPTLISSVRFAGNTVFGDGVSQAASERNGFVRRYDKRVADYLNSGSSLDQGTDGGRALAELSRVHKSINKEKPSADIVAFYFSLATHPGLKDRLFDFNAELRRDRDLKWVFIVFYGAMVYHVAQLMKARGLGMPRFLTFSGTGSRVLDIISTHNSGLETLAKLLFQRVYGVDAYAVPDGLTLVRERDFPKEVTCKGGLKMEEIDFQAVEKLTGNADVRTTLLGTGEALAGDTTTYQSVNDETLQEVGEEVRRFVQLLLSDLPFDFEGQFSVEGSLKTTIAPQLVRDLDSLLKEGWSKRLSQTGDKSKKLDETLFFLPLIEGLNRLANSLADQTTSAA